MWQLISAWFRRGGSASRAPGTVLDVAKHLQRLMEARAGSYLVVQIAGQDDAFLQFTTAPAIIQIDHPLMTPEKVKREEPLRAILSGAGFRPYESVGSDGSRFLDCDVPSDVASVTIIVERVLKSVFGVNSSTELDFIGEGLPRAG